MIKDYICVDLETTGLNPKEDKIIEIGAVKVRNGQVVDTFETFLNPGMQLEERITNLTGITDEMLVGAPDIGTCLPDFLEFAGEDILLGHSVLFDYSFLKKAAVNCKMTFERQGIDTLKIARKFLPDLESRSLGFLCEHYRISHNAHRALADAHATVELYNKLCEQFYKEEDFAASPLVYKVKREIPITKPQKERLYRLIDQHKMKIEQDEKLAKLLSMDVEKMTRNQASRYTDRLLSKFGK